MKINLALALFAVFVTSITAAPAPTPGDLLEHSTEASNDEELFGPLWKLGKLVLPKVISKVAMLTPKPKAAPLMSPPAPVNPMLNGSPGTTGGLPSNDNNDEQDGVDDNDDDTDGVGAGEKPQVQAKLSPPKPPAPPRKPVALRPPLPLPLFLGAPGRRVE